MGYWGTDRLDSDTALDMVLDIEGILVEKTKNVADLGQALAIADIVIAHEEIGRLTDPASEGGLVRMLIQGFLKNMPYIGEDFRPTVYKTISELTAKVIDFDIATAKSYVEEA